MRTIKRKRIFGGKKSIHKKKHKRSLKKFRGGVELNYLTPNQEIYKVKGILGYQKPGFLYTGEEKYGEDSLVDLTQPTTPNLFKGNIKHDKGSVILTDYKSLKSIKLGWIYGGHFGNIVIYSSAAEQLEEVIAKLNGFYFLKSGGLEIIKTLFIPEINERVIKSCEKQKHLINEISPWGDMTHEFDLNVDDITGEPSLDSIFKDILKKYYLEKIDGISKDKISLLLNTVNVGEPDINAIRADNKLLEKYKDILQRRNKSFVKEKEFTSENISGELDGEKWDKTVEPEQQYPEIYKNINGLRLKQEIIYKELTDIFSTYKKDTYPFNIEYFSCNIQSQPQQQSDILIKNIIEKFNIETPTEPKLLVKFNNRIYKSISKIMYILQIFNPNTKIYRNSEIVRYKNITNDEYNKPAAPQDIFFTSDRGMNGFREFMNGYVINSIIDPVIMARLLSFNIQIKATILLSCTNDNGSKTYKMGDEQFHELTSLDVNQEAGLYEKINDDELRLKIKRLKIGEKEITPEDLENSKTPGDTPIQNKLDEFKKVLNENGDIEKSIECELKNPFAKKSDDEIIKLNCKCKIYKKEEDNITNIMIYLYDDKSSFNHDLIKKILIKDNYNDKIYKDINGDHLENFYSHLFENDDDGHEHNYYDITF